jgi:hypothetical protein
MTDGITESQMLDFCGDLKSICENNRVTIIFNYETNGFELIPFDDYYTLKSIGEIQNNYYGE